MGWESTPTGQGGLTLLSTAPFFFLYRDLPFFSGGAGLVHLGGGAPGGGGAFFWWEVAREVCGGAGRGVEERRVHLLGAEATLLRDVLHSERCSALVYP